MKPFLYLFISILFCVNIVSAQEITASDTLNVSVTDSIVADSIAVDSTAVIPQKKPPFESTIKYKAVDSIVFRVSDRRVFLYNESQVNYEEIELQAYETEFDLATKIVYAQGGKDSVDNDIGLPVFKQGNETIDAVSLSYNFDNSKGSIHQIKTQQGEGYMHAEKAKRYADGHIDMAGGKYTTCDADHPHFYLALSKAKVMPGDQIVFGPAHMVLLDIPLPLVIPFGFFPYNNKQSVSGFMPPSVGMEVSRGLSITGLGYYFAFSDHFDATVQGDIYSTGTWRATLTSRYMKRYKFSGNLDLNYGNTVSGEKGLNQTKTKEYKIGWSHSQDAKAHPHRSFRANVNYSSSSYSTEYEYTNPNSLYQNTKSSSVNYQQSWPNSPFRLAVDMNISQNTSKSQSNAGSTTIKFPSGSFSMDRIYPFKKKESAGKAKWYEDIALTYNANFQNTLTGQEDNLFDERNIKNMKNGFQHSIPLSINFKALKFVNITPSLNYSGVLNTAKLKIEHRQEDLPGGGQRWVAQTDTVRGIYYAHAVSPSLSVSVNPKFYLMNVYGPDSKIEAIRTVISPTVSASYVPDISSLFDYTRTYRDSTGVEKQYEMYTLGAYRAPTAPGQSGSISVGISGNVEMKVRSAKDTTGVSRKIKILDQVSMSSSYSPFLTSDFKWSNIALRASTTIKGINLSANGTVDPYRLSLAGTRINEFGPRLTSVSFNTGLSLPLQKEGDQKKEDTAKDAEDDGYSYFDIPWNISFSYGLTYSKPLFEGKIVQTLSFSGNVTLTKKWSMSFNSSYDFEAKEIAYTTLNIQRDLHCWTMSFNCSPFGTAKYFFFQINVKSGMLRDLKYEKRKSQYDYPSW